MILVTKNQYCRLVSPEKDRFTKSVMRQNTFFAFSRWETVCIPGEDADGLLRSGFWRREWG